MQATFTRDYLGSVATVLGSLDHSSIRRSAELIFDAYEREARVLLAGNGGSSAIVSHLACDLEKTVAGPPGARAVRRLRALSLCDNVAALTAWANDEGYDRIFAERLRGHGSAGDVFLVVSSSGNSPNVLEGLLTARELGLTTIAWVGFDGGKASQLADCVVHVPVRDYGIVEGIHGVIAHLVTDLLVAAIRDPDFGEQASGPRLISAGAE